MPPLAGGPSKPRCLPAEPVPLAAERRAGGATITEKKAGTEVSAKRVDHEADDDRAEDDEHGERRAQGGTRAFQQRTHAKRKASISTATVTKGIKSAPGEDEREEEDEEHEGGDGREEGEERAIGPQPSQASRSVDW